MTRDILRVPDPVAAPNVYEHDGAENHRSPHGDRNESPVARILTQKAFNRASSENSTSNGIPSQGPFSSRSPAVTRYQIFSLGPGRPLCKDCISTSFDSLLSLNGTLRQPKDRFLRRGSPFSSRCVLCSTIKKTLAFRFAETAANKKNSRRGLVSLPDRIHQRKALSRDSIRLCLNSVQSALPNESQGTHRYQISDLSVWSAFCTSLYGIQTSEFIAGDVNLRTLCNLSRGVGSRLSLLGYSEYSPQPMTRLLEAIPSEVARNPSLRGLSRTSSTATSVRSPDPVSGPSRGPRHNIHDPRSLRTKELKESQASDTNDTFILKTSWSEFTLDCLM